MYDSSHTSAANAVPLQRSEDWRSTDAFPFGLQPPHGGVESIQPGLKEEASPRREGVARLQTRFPLIP